MNFSLFVAFWLLFACSMSQVKTLDTRLNGAHLYLPAALNPPLLIAEKGPDGNVTYRGLDKSVADFLAASFNFTYSYVQIDPVYVKERGYTQTYIDMLLNGTIDIISTAMSRSWTRTAYMDLSYPYVINVCKLTTPYPKEKSRLLAPIRPFDMTAWALLGVSLIVTAAVLTLIAICYSSDSIHFWDTFWRYLMYAINSALGQDDSLPFTRNSSRFAVAGWCLIALVMVNSYSSQLASYLTLPVYEKPVNSFEDLANRPDLPMTVASSSVFLQTLMDARSGPYKVFADAIRQHPEYIYKTVPESLEKIFSGRFSFATVAAYIEIIVAKDYKEHKTCRLAVSKSLPVFDQLVYGLPKNGLYNEVINNRFIFMWERGLVEGWLRPFRDRYEQCIVRPTKPRMATLKLKDLYSAFILLGIGICSAVFAFIYERVAFTRKSRINLKK